MNVLTNIGSATVVEIIGVAAGLAVCMVVLVALTTDIMASEDVGRKR